MSQDPRRDGSPGRLDPLDWLVVGLSGLSGLGLFVGLDRPGAPLDGPWRVLAAITIAALAWAVLSLRRWVRMLEAELAARPIASPTPAVAETEVDTPIERLARSVETLTEAIRQAPIRTDAAAVVVTVPAAAPDHLAPVRAALAAGRWSEASDLAEALALAAPDDPAAQAARSEVASRRAEAVDDLRARLEAARGANDADSVLELRGGLAELLSTTDRRALDRELLKWFMGLLMRRMRTGSVGGDVARLADRIATEFPDSPEGASLKASLPTLRRSAGLCARCSQPYTGIEAACPECLAAPAPAGPTLLPFPDEPEPVEDDPALAAGSTDLEADLSFREPE